MGVAVGESSKRCALPGCGATIEIIPGRPERRYCTAAHRVEARRVRRAAAQSGDDARLAEALPWLRPAGEPARRPAAEPRQRTDRSPHRPVPERTVRGNGSPRRSRAVAALGAAGLIVGGYVITASEPVRPASPGVAAQASPGYSSPQDWAARAQVALTSVDRQLDVIAQTEEVWNRVPAAQRVGAPLPVRMLQERKALLERQKTTLQSQLAAYRSLGRATDELRRAEEQLAIVEKALRDVPPEALRTPEQAAVIAALDQQREVLERRRDAKREELRSLSDGVRNASRTALPDDSSRTTDVSNEVLALAQNPRGDDGAPDERSSLRRPEVVSGRDKEDDRPGAHVATSGPPDPRGPGDETAERRANPDDRGSGNGGGPVETVTGAVRDVAAGANEAVSAPAGGAARAAEPAAAGPAAVERPVQRVVETTDDVAAGPRRSGNGSGGVPPQAAPRPAEAPGAPTDAPVRPPEPSLAAAPAPQVSGPPGQPPSAVAGPAIRTMTAGFASPYTDAALQQADREVASRYPAPEGTDGSGPVRDSGNSAADASAAQQWATAYQQTMLGGPVG
ncbi:hypothetical protein [Pseudonocardia asaccharolytica]|uniref:Uncharacterized protein n=1 Tax=Pseudonocardia asaccharolytica DSM 44247 = NBRC 16224 TaxID=1123024 RepID=A0A511CWQ9_9PSEU|nr:hypothetical protein [Pseudonocardia asaccharolytica]GEL16991.1 hypothetical protein PA7_08280 [Pseudonocardia asaccharolytica DSM 44247 = NBRC 16224]